MTTTHKIPSKHRAARAVALASALCCAAFAHAQTGEGVTLYGLADVGITSTSGLKAGRVTQVASGIMEGSRWGMKGTEDLGGGYKAIFTLEARVELDTGSGSNTPISGAQLSDRYQFASLLIPNFSLYPLLAQGSLQAIADSVRTNGLAPEFGVNVGTGAPRYFDRQAYVGMVTPFGAVLAGRMYTPGFETNVAYDIMETQSGLSAGQIVAFPAVLEIRKSNAIQYRFVKDGISGALMYALGEVAGGADKSRMLGFNANYKVGGFSVGFGHNTANNELGQKSLTTSVLGASMDYGSDKITGMVMTMKDDNPSGMTRIGMLLSSNANPAVAANANLFQTAYTNAFRQDGLLYHVGYRHTTGPHAVSLAFTSYNDKRASNADVKSYGAAYTYALSKRTDLNAVLVRYDNGDKGQVAPGGNGYIGGVTASAGTDSTAVQLGIRHRF